MEINFFIRTQTDTGRIRVWVSHKGEKYFAKTDIIIPAGWWDHKKGCMKSAYVPTSIRKDIETKLSDIKSLIVDSDIHSSDQLTAIIKSGVYGNQIKQDLISDKYLAYVKTSSVCDRRKDAFLSLHKKLVRYETIFGTLKFDTVKDIQAFECFVMNEPLYYDKHPDLYPNGRAKERGQNYVNDILRRLRTFLKAQGNEVFKTYTFKSYRYADPIAHTTEELDLIWNYKPVSRYIERVRDMYLLHCHIGARVSDYVSLKKNNVQDGILTYIANKNIAKSQKTVYVPLSERALKIIDKWDEPDRLFPFLNVYGASGYNNGIKILLQAAGIDRLVYTINTVTGLPELKPFFEIASTHTARKTFISCVLNKVKSEYITSKMTDHVEGSRVLKRYGKVQVDTLKDVIRDVFD